VFDKALARFAEAYADQNEADFRRVAESRPHSSQRAVS
jgi:hypothetical protein